MPTDSHRACVPGAAAIPPNTASRYAAAAQRSAAPPRRSAAPGPSPKASPTGAAIRSGAARQTAPVTGGAGGNGATQGSARPADGAGRRTIARSASHAARRDARSTAGAIAPDAPPAAVCAANSPRSGACRAVAGASRWRRSASLPSGRAPSAGSDMPAGAQEANVWIARCPSVAQPAVRAAHTVPTLARPSAISFRCGRRRSP